MKKGEKMSEEDKKRIRDSSLKQFKNGMPEETKRKLSEALKGEKNAMWKGGIVGILSHLDKDSYKYKKDVHYWVKTMKGKASGYQCVDCDEQAQEWSNNNNHVYRQILRDYSPRCRSCHFKYDNN